MFGALKPTRPELEWERTSMICRVCAPYGDADATSTGLKEGARRVHRPTMKESTEATCEERRMTMRGVRLTGRDDSIRCQKGTS